MTSHFEESTIKGTRATSGSAASSRRKCVISARASSSPSSMLMSITCAPSSTCLRAMATASSYCFSLIRRRNLREPATLHRSPTLRKLFAGQTSTSSSPARCRCSGRGAGRRGGTASHCSIKSPKALMNRSSVPQQPPMIFTRRFSKKGFISAAICSGVWLYCPKLSGSPALG